MLPISILDPITPQSAISSPFLAAASMFTSPNSARAAAASASSTSGPVPNNQLTGNDFITLLAAQLQAQDPLNPIDPTTFVTQLVQFNQLEQLININQTLSGVPAATASSSATPLNQSLATAASARAVASK